MTNVKNKPPPGAGQSTLDADDQGRVLRSAGTVGLITFLSRISGAVRDIVFTYLLGTGLHADAFVAAFRLPNTLRRLVGEGNVSAAFVPVFQDVSQRRDRRQLWQLADGFHAAVMYVAAALTVVGIAAAPWLVRTLLVPGFADEQEAWELTTRLARTTFPYLIFIALAAVLMAVLNANDRFAAAAFTPVLFNLALIIGGLGLSRGMVPVHAWALAAVIGGFLQWAFLVPFAWRLGMRFRPQVELSDPAMRRIGALMVPGVFGVGIIQINVLVGQYLASFLQEGSIAALYLAARLHELTLGVFVISVATVVLPLMSRQAARGEREQFVATVNFALRQVTMITLPATVGLIVLRAEIVTVLFERGMFDASSTALTSGAVWGYAIGLIGVATVRIVAPGFYALKDTRTPVQVAAVAMIANVIGCVILMRTLQHAGIALANSLAAYLNALLLLWLFRRTVGRIGGRQLLVSFVRLAAAAALMAWVVSSLAAWWDISNRAGFLAQATSLAAVIVIGALTYVAATAALRAPELAELRLMLGGAAPTQPPSNTADDEHSSSAGDPGDSGDSGGEGEAR